MNGPCQIVSLKKEKHNNHVRLKEVQNNNSTNRKSNVILIMILVIEVLMRYTQNINARRIIFKKGIQPLKNGIRYFCHNNVFMFFF